MAKVDNKSSRKVELVMHEFKEGKLKNGSTGKPVKDPKQAVAIGSAEARKADRNPASAPDPSGSVPSGPGG
ncbi:MAG: DUF6496 domain-containing protein [Methyloversatilis sp.]|nr:DUF6496 domain-containing protein [Methyloversatilis sp.]